MKSLFLAIIFIFALSSGVMAKGGQSSTSQSNTKHPFHPHRPVNHRVYLPQLQIWFTCNWPTAWRPECL